jgi:hypothetical protein
MMRVYIVLPLRWSITAGQEVRPKNEEQRCASSPKKFVQCLILVCTMRRTGILFPVRWKIFSRLKNQLDLKEKFRFCANAWPKDCHSGIQMIVRVMMDAKRES